MTDDEEKFVPLVQPKFKSRYWQRRWMSMPKKKRQMLLYRASYPHFQIAVHWQDDQSWWAGAEERTKQRYEEWLKKCPPH